MQRGMQGGRKEGTVFRNVLYRKVPLVHLTSVRPSVRVIHSSKFLLIRVLMQGYS